MTAPQPEPSLLDAAAFLALVQAQAAAREQLVEQALGLVRWSAAGFTGWYDHRQITAWSAKLARDVEPFLRALARSTDAFQARAMSQLTGRRVPPVGAIDVSTVRAGVTPADTYARAADAYRWQQAQQDTAARGLLAESDPRVPELQDPLAAAVERMTAAAETNTQLVVRNQSQRSMRAAGDRGLITGWRRVIHPELSKGGTCGLCVAASDRLYGPKEPMPLHDRCNCVPMPVRDHQDPGSTLNADDLNRLYKEAGSTSAAKLKRTRYQVTEHGELGPQLSPHGQKVRTADQARRDTRTAPPKTAEQKAADLAKVRNSLIPARDKAQALAEANPKKWGDYLTKLEARIRDLDHQLAA